MVSIEWGARRRDPPTPRHSARLTGKERERERKKERWSCAWILPFWMASSFQRGEHFSDGSKIRRKRHFFKTGVRHRAGGRSAFPTGERRRRRTSSVTLQPLQVLPSNASVSNSGPRDKLWYNWLKDLACWDYKSQNALLLFWLTVYFIETSK